jgi:DNA gyrase/topoisomerase IV subunit A
MDTLVPNSYRKYGKYVNSFRSFPLKEDGLKPVERRLLLTTHLIAREKHVI